ncbi:1322_t:CDS:2, partial [Entrophospora sp. SA101]
MHSYFNNNSSHNNISDDIFKLMMEGNDLTNNINFQSIENSSMSIDDFFSNITTSTHDNYYVGSNFGSSDNSSSSCSNDTTANNSAQTTPVISQDTNPVEELVSSKPNGDKPSKSSNAFIIYRKAYVKELHSRGINLQMTQISPMVSESWKKEPANVKAEYKKLADVAKQRYKIIWPAKVKRRH